MSKNILGIDLGTSSVKMILKKSDGSLLKSKASYVERSPEGWMSGIQEAFQKICENRIDVISLSSQVGTYIVNEKDVISWDSGVGREELAFVKEKYDINTFIDEIAMPHPDIISYPIPRLLYIKKHYENIESICQPKDLIGKYLTGNWVTEKYSYRGLVHTRTGQYSQFFLKEIGIDAIFLPSIISCDDIIGHTTETCEEFYGIPKGIPVVAGLNDFFASVMGMEAKEGELFDISGTSEHIGIICDELVEDTKMVSGVYFDKFIHYGVTASSGCSLDFGIRELELENMDITGCLKNNPPIFTPYLNGERAPIFDTNARGVFFGIHGRTTKKDMAYAVLEGVVFSLYHIYESMGKPEIQGVRICGGAAQNDDLNRLKAELFGVPVHVLKENDTSALGVIRLLTNENINEISYSILPTGKMRERLLERYEIYKSIYPALREQFEKGSQL